MKLRCVAAAAALFSATVSHAAAVDASGEAAERLLAVQNAPGAAFAMGSDAS